MIRPGVRASSRSTGAASSSDGTSAAVGQTIACASVSMPTERSSSDGSERSTEPVSAIASAPRLRPSGSVPRLPAGDARRPEPRTPAVVQRRADARRIRCVNFGGDDDAMSAPSDCAQSATTLRRGHRLSRQRRGHRDAERLSLLAELVRAAAGRSSSSITLRVDRAGYSIAPMIQGLYSSSPTPASSLLVRSPDATARIFSKISWPSSSRLTPSSTLPALMSMSGSWLA